MSEPHVHILRSRPCSSTQISTDNKGNYGSFSADDNIYINFLKFYKCYELIPNSSKILVFDTQLSVKKAFYALVYNGVRSAPLWDSSRYAFVGMLTITDFINMLKMYYKSPNIKIEVLEEHKIETWRRVMQVKPFISIDPDASLFEAVQKLLENRIHRLPIVNPHSGNALYILTHKRLLGFISLYMQDLPNPSFLDKSIGDLKIGTLDSVAYLFEDSPIIEALRLFVELRVSALPVLNRETNKVVDIYAKFDVVNLAAEKTYGNLEVGISEALKYRKHIIDQVHNCLLNERLGEIIDRIVKAGVHRLVILDEEMHLKGMLSLSDILGFFLKEFFTESPEYAMDTS